MNIYNVTIGNQKTTIYQCLFTIKRYTLLEWKGY